MKLLDCGKASVKTKGDTVLPFLENGIPPFNRMVFWR